MKKTEKLKLKTLNVLYWVLMFPIFVIGAIFSILSDICEYIIKFSTICIDFLRNHLYTEDWEFNDSKEWSSNMKKPSEFETFAEIFEYALDFVKNKKIKEAKQFYEAYIQYLYDVNPRDKVISLDHARICAENNFGYWAGYYGDDVRKLVKKHFNAIHPIFGDRYNISAEEAFKLGIERANQFNSK